MTDGTTVTLDTAREAVIARKRAAGLGPGEVGRTDDYLGLLAGTDLDNTELEAWAQGQGRALVPVFLAAGPVVACASAWRDGVLIGIEYQRQRDAPLEQRVRDLRGALEDVRRRLGDAQVATRPAARGMGAGGDVELLPINRAVMDALGIVEEALER